MYLALVKDKIPEVQSENQVSYAVAQSDDLYVNLLTEKFVSAATSFLNGGGLEALVDTQLIIEALAEVNKEKYTATYNSMVETYGKYEKRLMSVQMNAHAEDDNITVEAAENKDSYVS